VINLSCPGAGKTDNRQTTSRKSILPVNRDKPGFVSGFSNVTEII